MGRLRNGEVAEEKKKSTPRWLDSTYTCSVSGPRILPVTIVTAGPALHTSSSFKVISHFVIHERFRGVVPGERLSKAGIKPNAGGSVASAYSIRWKHQVVASFNELQSKSWNGVYCNEYS